MSRIPTTGPGAQTVVVGLSGGVDSSVAAWMLLNQGYSVVGVTLALARPGEVDQARSCCSPELMGKAKGIADHLGIPHYAADKIDEFQYGVVQYFVEEYAVGRTPNPCAKCNSRLRFAALIEIAERLGAGLVATGHYARLVGTDKHLSRGVDPQKDQSYVLAEVDPQLLSRCLFPLGGYTKEQVRALAGEAGLAQLVSVESQEICFVPNDDYRAFLRTRLGDRPGDIVDTDGRVLGHHQGTYNYTIGQRKGLGGCTEVPLYVVAVHAERREVVAAPLGIAGMRGVHFSVSAIHRKPLGDEVSVQLRSAGKPLKGTLRGKDSIVLHEPAPDVTPGQTVVVYEGEDVILGGTIISAYDA
jgi:tRNA-specific 2-thiouridylase